LVLYYYRGMNQAQIGKHFGVSQMQVSRLLARALGYLRPRIFGQPDRATGTVAPRIGLSDPASRPRRPGRAPAESGPAAPEPDNLRARAS
jgi:hypothetical protein